MTVRNPVIAYGVSLVAVAAALGLHLLLGPLLGERLPFITLFAAVVFAAWYSGQGPAWLALVASAVGASFFVFQPRYSLAIQQLEYQVGLVLYIAVCVITITMFESLQKAQRQAEEQQRQLEQEVAARQRIEETLHAAEERLQLAILIGNAGTWDLDLVTGRNIWSTSHFTLLGHEPTPNREATVDMWQNAVLAEDLPEVLTTMERARREHDMLRSEHRLRRADNGKIIWVRAAGRFFYDSSDTAVRFIGVFFDVTAQKEAEQQINSLLSELQEANRRKDEFLATLAHELRNPLAPVRNSLELMKRVKNNADLIEQARTTMERQIGQMVRLIDDLLDVSRITRNRLELKKERVELASVVHHAVEACHPNFDRAGHEFYVTLPSEPIYLHADPMRLAQVIGNLLSNACKYTHPHGCIWLTVERQGSEVTIAVKDTGIGIPTDMLDKVFDLFVQLDRSLERSAGGLGIGLSLVKRLIEMHDGTVTAFSAGSGQGSEFVVYLPVLMEIPQAQPLPKSIGEASWTTDRRILVVDDNRDGADSLAMLLKLTGSDTLTAYDGLEAVEKAAAFRPDVILLDIGLPKINGYEVCHRIREQPWGNAMVIVALTGWGQEEDRRKSKEAGFDEHLVKPVDHAALMKLLATRFADKSH